MKSSRDISRWLMLQFEPAKKYWFLASLAGMISAIGYIFFARYVSLYAGNMISEKIVTTHWLQIALFWLVVRVVAQYVYLHASLKGGEKVAEKMRQKLLPHLLHSMWLESSKATYYYTESVKRLTPFYGRYIPSAIQAIVVPLCLLLFIFPVNSFVAIILLLALLLIPVQMMAAGIGAESIHKKHIQVVSTLSGLFADRIVAMPTLKRLGRVPKETERISEATTILNNTTMKMMKVAMLSSALMEFFSMFAVAIVAIYIGMGLLKYITWGLPDGGLPLQDGLFLLMLAPYFFVPLRKFVAAYHDRNDAIAAGEQLIPVFNTEIAHQPKSTSAAFENISLKNVSFRYPDRCNNAVNNITLRLPNKGIVLLSGPSGSGKSTLLLLLSGYLQPLSGSVVVDTLQRTDSACWLRQNSTWMGQHSFLFSGTIEENIDLFSGLKLNKEALEKEADLRSIVKHKAGGWRALVKEAGFGLSGGEKQRIGLARLLHHRRPLLLVDEPTAHVDAATARTIFDALQKLASTHCIVLASHHPDSFGIADTIIYLEDGIIVDTTYPKQNLSTEIPQDAHDRVL